MKKAGRVRVWVRRGFLTFAVVSHLYLFNTVRTRNVGDELLRSTNTVVVADRPATLEFLPRVRAGNAGLVFLCGSGITAEAYARLLRPIADRGHAVIIVRLPYRFAPLPSHKDDAVRRARDVMNSHREVPRWVVAGHSLGGALAARVAPADPSIAALVLIGTTHPKEADLSSLAMPVTKIYASNDGVAPVERVMANKHLLPAHTKWIEIRGGNHSQFGHYGHQLLDGRARISRDAQQSITRSAIVNVLREAGPRVRLYDSNVRLLTQRRVRASGGV